MTKIRSTAEFMRSLSARQRQFFVERERELRRRLQASLLDLSRGLGQVSELHGEALDTLLAAGDSER